MNPPKLSKQIRLLQNKWRSNAGWPKRLESIEIKGLRGWLGQRIDFNFPIIAISGENGSGKSTILQCAAAIYGPPAETKKRRFASDFFPDTPWDTIRAATITGIVRQGDATVVRSVRKPTDRWRGNPDRPQRPVAYIDLARIQPVSARTGYLKLAKATIKETASTLFAPATIARLSEIMGRPYASGKMAITEKDITRPVPVISINGKDVSGFHQGAGEFTVTELLQNEIAKYSLVLIDEIETSLHPRAQRRLIRDLAEMCRQLELQIILTTHSPYVLEELPPEARGYILSGGDRKEVVFGVSPDFAMTQMDEEIHPECDLYVEDRRAKILLQEVLVKFAPDLNTRIEIIPFGTASVGKALGLMVNENRFPRASVVFLDGDQAASPGCALLPGGDAPERVVFDELRRRKWALLDALTTRDFAQLADALELAMTSSDHHEWIPAAANKLVLGGDTLWQIMCAAWVGNCLTAEQADTIIAPIRAALL
jgi:predicted ATPase